jgi:hypothetical protein
MDNLPFIQAGINNLRTGQTGKKTEKNKNKSISIIDSNELQLVLGFLKEK